MRDGAKRLARLAMLTALGAVLVFLTGVVPAGRLGLMAAASFPVCIAVMMYGYGWAFGVFAATAILSYLLFPASVLGYVIFFGYYPIAKSLFERIHQRWLSWLLKYLLFAAVLLILWRAGLLAGALTVSGYALVLIGAAALWIYDWCCSLLIQFYLNKIARYFS